MTSLYKIVKEASLTVDETSANPVDRTLYSVLASTMAELGELGEEAMIANGQSYKEPGEDGVVGEALDTIACLLDLIHVHAPDVTEDQLNAFMAKKCAKWVRKVSMVGKPCRHPVS